LKTPAPPSHDPLAGIIFDMDGVLCDSEPYICEAACRMFAEIHATEVQPADFRPFVGMGENRYLGGVAEKHGIPLQLPRDKTTTYDIYMDIIQGRLQPLPGVHDFIAIARESGLKLAIATSADARKMDENLNAIGLAKSAFETCVSGDMVEHKKPHPEIFLAAAEQLSLAPQDCLVVEDALSGVCAAKAAGSRCLGLTSSFSAAELTAAGADWVAKDLSESLFVLSS
jgi:beta-phosphoglucomutase